MIDLVLILPVVAYALFQALCNKWHDKERDATTVEHRTHASKKWHFWQGAEHITVFTLAGFAVFFGSWKILIILPFIYYAAFDGIRAITLDKNWWYQGQSSVMDKKFGKLSNILEIGLLVISVLTYILITALL